MTTLEKALDLLRDFVLPPLALLCAFGICVMTAKSYWLDLACRDTTSVETCRAELGIGRRGAGPWTENDLRRRGAGAA
jgi:hypothetical protein